VQRGERAVGERMEQREMKEVDMEMQNVEFLDSLAHLVEHEHVVGDGVLDGRIEPQRGHGAAGELGGGDGIAAGEQRHVVPELHQFFGQIGDDPLGAAIQARRHALHQGGDLRNTHRETSLLVPAF
jgi:hypothetical protein